MADVKVETFDWPHVGACELAIVAKRRMAAGGTDGAAGARVRSPDASLPLPDATASVTSNELLQWNLTGLALSGGGIRSAAFSLGVLQSLAHDDLLRKFDYMSTVSGGGYIGACLSSLLVDNPTSFPLGRFRDDDHTTGVGHPALAHVRRNANYLSPHPSLLQIAHLRALSAYGLGLVVSLFTIGGFVGAFVAVALSLVHRLAILVGRYTANAAPGCGLSYLKALTDALLLPIAQHVGAIDPAMPAAYFLFGAALVVASMSGVAWLGYGLACLWLAEKSRAQKKERDLDARDVDEDLQWRLLRTATISASLAALVPIVRYTSRQPLPLAILTGAVVVCLVLLASRRARWSAAVNEAGTLLVAVLVGLGGLALLWRFQTHSYAIAMVCTGAFLITLALPINRTSLFYFYRDSLSRAFIFKMQRPDDGKGDDRAVTHDELLLSRVHPWRHGWPYHLINTTVNVAVPRVKPGTGRAPLGKTTGRRRPADFFLLSPLFCGSSETTYVATKQFEGNTLTLAGAMAISGAAANPATGFTTRPLSAFVLGLLNARLGVWVQSPRACNGKPVRMAFWPKYLWSEMCLKQDGKRYANLSDGGHVENLGVYELLRRRCRVVVAVDAGADADGYFGDLGNLIATARINLGVRIELPVAELKPAGRKRLSRAHFATGTIYYPSPPGKAVDTGHFIYIKPAMTSDCAVDLLAYRERHSSFPHEPTTNQFFGEAQFEAYRELGFRSAAAARQAIGLALQNYACLDGIADEAQKTWNDLVQQALDTLAERELIHRADMKKGDTEPSCAQSVDSQRARPA